MKPREMTGDQLEAYLDRQERLDDLQERREGYIDGEIATLLQRGNADAIIAGNQTWTDVFLDELGQSDELMQVMARVAAAVLARDSASCYQADLERLLTEAFKPIAQANIKAQELELCEP